MAIGRKLSLTPNVKSKKINVTATNNQSLFTVAGGYRINNIGVYRNGALLAVGKDFLANDGSTVTLLSVATAGDIVQFEIFDTHDLVGSIGANGDQVLNGALTVTGIVSASSINIGSAITFTDAGINVTGVVTATSFEGDGSLLTGIAATDTIAAASLTVSGISTFTGVVKGLSDVRVTGNLNAGITTLGALTVTSITGDGSGLTGVANTDVVHTREITASGVSTFSNDVQFNSDVTFQTANGNNIVLDKSQNSLEFGDSAVATFGAGRDLLIYHDSNNSYIQDNATGDLILQSNSTVKVKPGDDDGITANSNGSIQLYQDGVERFHTEAHGVEVVHAGTASTSRFLAGGSVGVGIGVTTTTGRDAVGAAGTVKGQIVYNETDDVVQVYNGTRWDQLSNVPSSATGGDTSAGVAPGNGYQYHVFTSPGSLTVAGGEVTADMLLVAGGGGGSGGMGSNNHAGGGGGAGGIAEVVNMPLQVGTYPVTVPTSNAGGGSGTTGVNAPNGSNGGNVTVASTPVGTITAKGGGGGASGPSGSSNPGGSGGGGGSFDNTPGGSSTQPGTNPSPLITDYGNAGGQAGDSSADASAAGGGGAGGSGQGTSEPNVAGNGGPARNFSNYPYPLYSPIVPSPFQPNMAPSVGSNGTFGGGGGGGQGNSGSGGNGGTGGGTGGTVGPNPGSAAQDGTGGGGGGGSGGNGGEGGNGGQGGRGILIMRITL